LALLDHMKIAKSGHNIFRFSNFTAVKKGKQTSYTLCQKLVKMERQLLKKKLPPRPPPSKNHLDKYAGDKENLFTPLDTNSPIEHSTAIRPKAGSSGQRFFASLSKPSPRKQQRPPQSIEASWMPKLQDMSAILNGISIVSAIHSSSSQ
jgi:hypothetical protein